MLALCSMFLAEISGAFLFPCGHCKGQKISFYFIRKLSWWEQQFEASELSLVLYFDICSWTTFRVVLVVPPSCHHRWWLSPGAPLPPFTASANMGASPPLRGRTDNFNNLTYHSHLLFSAWNKTFASVLPHLLTQLVFCNIQLLTSANIPATVSISDSII